MYWITAIALLVAINGSLQLSRHDFKKKDVCPKLAGIPACYIVFLFFLVGGVSHIINTTLATKAFYLLIGVPAVIALIGSVVELSGRRICPKTKGGIPMCYISLGMCLFILTTKYFN